jgi:Tellurite resistance protein TerB
MFDNVQSFLGMIAQPDIQQVEREATLELMVMTMYIDKSLKLAEDEVINQYLSSITWESWLPSNKFLGVAIAKVRNALGSKEKTIALLEDINSRLSDEERKSKALQACRELAIADGELSQEEKDFLETVTQVFQIS